MSLDHTKQVVDGISLSAAFGSFLGYLPEIAAVLSIIWTVIRIYETKTVQRWIHGDTCNASTD